MLATKITIRNKHVLHSNKPTGHGPNISCQGTIVINQGTNIARLHYNRLPPVTPHLMHLSQVNTTHHN